MRVSIVQDTGKIQETAGDVAGQKDSALHLNGGY